MVSRREIRRRIKKEWRGEISEGCIRLISEITSELLDEVIQEGINELEEINEIRKKANLPIYKRLPKRVFKSLSGRLKKAPNRYKNGKLGYHEPSEPLIYQQENVEVI